MLTFLDSSVDINTILQKYSGNPAEKVIIDIYSKSETAYKFQSSDDLDFEIKLRRNIVNSAIELNRTNFPFKTFRKSYCNENFWERTDNGGFLLRRDIAPSDAVKDIYINSSMYGTECATAIVIVFYNAILSLFGSELFNKTFPRIYLMDWQHLDRTLGIHHYNNVKDFFPGDNQYIKNPDVSPLTPEWQGENVINLDTIKFYGHGVGIRTSNEIINILNRFRSEGSQTSAYLLNSAAYPNFERLAKIYYQ